MTTGTTRFREALLTLALLATGAAQALTITSLSPQGEVSRVRQLVAKFDSAAVLKGAELLGKHYAMFTEKRELSGPEGGPIPVQAVPLSPEQLKAELKARGLPTDMLEK